MKGLVALGVDAGFASCGWGVVVRMGSVYNLRAQGTIRTEPSDGSTAERLLTITQNLVRVVRQWDPNVVGVEDVELRPGQTWKNKKTGEEQNADGGSLLQTAKVVGIACVCAPAARVELLKNGAWRGVLGIRKASEVKARLIALLGPDVAGSEHSRDALGIALAAFARWIP